MSNPRFILSRSRFMRKLVMNKDVLDVGCIDHSLENRKTGRWLHDVIRGASKHTVGMDYEAREVEQLRKEGYDAVVGDATDFNLNRKFDMVVAGELIEHLVNPEGFLNAVSKHLRPGGALILSTPNSNSIIYSLEHVLFGREIDNPDHTCIFSSTTITTMLAKCGYEVQDIVFLAENTTYSHPSFVFKCLALIRQAVQITAAFVRPNLCHQLVVIARVKS